MRCLKLTEGQNGKFNNGIVCYGYCQWLQRVHGNGLGTHRHHIFLHANRESMRQNENCRSQLKIVGFRGKNNQ